MPFQPLNGILQSLEHNQSSWRSRKQFKALVMCWPQVVGVAVAAQTRPIALQRGTLIVATSSPAWAQNLAFERQHLLHKLKQKLRTVILPEELTDIRFSTGQWASRGASPQQRAAESALVWQNHPSYLPPPPPSPTNQAVPGVTDSSIPLPTAPKQAFQKWAAHMQARSRHLPLCPQCQCPTPQGELDRWSVCGLCAPQHWTRRGSNGESPQP
jgi:predicted nucleic acid-binding Zn ribbon protein